MEWFIENLGTIAVVFLGPPAIIVFILSRKTRKKFMEGTGTCQDCGTKVHANRTFCSVCTQRNAT
jgi:hypothetical protein